MGGMGEGVEREKELMSPNIDGRRRERGKEGEREGEKKGGREGEKEGGRSLNTGHFNPTLIMKRTNSKSVFEGN